jgi:hypothetical protein
MGKFLRPIAVFAVVHGAYAGWHGQQLAKR